MDSNAEIELAWQCVEHTGSHLFLTGKAGTGKTTFLRKLKERSPKRMIVVAPTGIAAINAGGVTIHSFFQLPFAPYIPESKFTSAQSPYTFGREKTSIIRSMDLLVIDEISMVRADLLDAIDAVLRRYRDKHKPFGGVQLLMIGDLQQLAPVVKESDWALLSPYYDTSFFFGSHALKETDYITIQLQKVYRQSDDVFISLLNKIRANDIDHAILAELNKRYIPDFQPDEDEGYIRLTTHNYQAQRINENQLALLPGKSYRFEATIEGDFPESAYPADVDLQLKKGAQIMFLKNDSSGEKRFYNGKIGIVTAVNQNSISVWGKGDERDFVLEQEEWANSKYTINSETKEITEEIEGTFRQYPIRLAWAITIHKSQGLTFDRAIIDAHTSFAHGQVYVALSRCKTLEGIVLSSPLARESVINDKSISSFTRAVENSFPDKNRLNELQRRYYYELLCELFGFANIKKYFSQSLRLLDEFLYDLYPKTLEGYKTHFLRFQEEIEKVSVTFQGRYAELMLNPDYAEDPVLNERLVSGARYFHEKATEILQTLIRKTRVEPDNKELKKRFDDAFFTLKEQVHIKLGTLAYTAENGFTVPGYLRNKAHIIVALSNPQASKKKEAEFTPKAKEIREIFRKYNAGEPLKAEELKFVLASLKDGKKAKSTKATKPAKPAKTEKVEKIEVSSDIDHPELYQALVRWRNNVAVRTGLPVYTVLRQKAILGIVNTLPATSNELERIPFFGKKILNKYGTEILHIVEAYMKKAGNKR
ncbi:MAG: AAA family ATPase [Mediterranea sp.]|jgi:GTPase SAR1 family protein|nr:AAA family ATPase [Mediterranea sp.]